MELDLAQLKAFVQVVENGGISTAAQRLGVAKSALSERLAKLEGALHIKLLHRSPRGVTLTDAGKRFYDSACAVLSRLQQAVDEVSGDDARSINASLRITAPMTFGTQYLGPLLFAFMRRHPGLDITLDLDDRYVDLLAGGFDLGVRIGRLHDSSLMARALAPSRRVLCCSPDYAERRGTPKTIADVAAHDCICYGNASVAPYWQFTTSAAEPEQIVVRGRIHLNNGESMRDAAIAGLGLAALPHFIAAPALRDGRLVEVLAPTPPTADTIYAVYPRTRYVNRGVRAIIDMLVETFADGAPWDEEAAPRRRKRR
ncbi:LysR family transcriptional regulator [Dokdonella sp.]|uniref:LysR family transcriptional regulator n=1 Tax=Dokdonella sp. TaxID=2291710 RepID=UPI001B2B3D78|nr:LysR family transcriptional regulator [Dokdonella sp.]MBO9664424.1 LysR family transcriptional regulator [Dokdonella sp.]